MIYLITKQTDATNAALTLYNIILQYQIASRYYTHCNHSKAMCHRKTLVMHKIETHQIQLRSFIRHILNENIHAYTIQTA